MCNNYGWVCPKCGCVLAPWISECPHHLPIQATIPTPLPWTPIEPSVTVPNGTGDFLVQMGGDI